MAAFAGSFLTEDSTNSQLNDGNVFRIRDDDQIIQTRNRNTAEFYMFLRQVSQGRTLTQPKFRWGKDDKSPNFVTVKASATSGATSIDVYDAFTIIAGDRLLNVDTNELLRVDAITDTDTISVVASAGFGRGLFGTTAKAMLPGQRLLKTGNLLEEKGVVADANVFPPQEDFNHIELWTKTVEIGNLQEETAMLEDIGQMSYQTLRKLWEFDEEINAALYVGRRGLIETSKGPLYTMNGFDAQVKTFSFDGTGVQLPTWEMFNQWMAPTFDSTESSSMKTLFCGPNLYNSILETARMVGIHPTTWETTLGSEVKMIGVDNGSVQLIKDYKFFRGPLAGSGRLVDGANVDFRAMRGFDRTMIKNVQLPNEIMETKHAFLQSGSLAVQHEHTHAIFNGFSGAFNDGPYAK